VVSIIGGDDDCFSVTMVEGILGLCSRFIDNMDNILGLIEWFLGCKVAQSI
jgi:hypothetical protein